jgi:hypothetical protein
MGQSMARMGRHLNRITNVEVLQGYSFYIIITFLKSTPGRDNIWELHTMCPACHEMSIIAHFVLQGDKSKVLLYQLPQIQSLLGYRWSHRSLTGGCTKIRQCLLVWLMRFAHKINLVFDSPSIVPLPLWWHWILRSLQTKPRSNVETSDLHM